MSRSPPPSYDGWVSGAGRPSYKSATRLGLENTKGTESSVKFQDGSGFLQSRIDGCCLGALCTLSSFLSLSDLIVHHIQFVLWFGSRFSYLWYKDRIWPTTF